ncbi:tubulin tyrosine ligase-like 12 isoform X4 [Rhipicephalus microplus]|uniref:tubulin tyrosine ligase-like 12 isoform X4 n=1 Tax=Rhipicephalus microplus TaxID=6941 RepID=UPI003F6BE6FB
MPSRNCVDELQKFVNGHRDQLETSGIPPHFWPTLHWKLHESVQEFSDGDSAVPVEVMDTAEQGEEEAKHYSVKVVVTREDGICCQDSEHVYLVDHAWTCRPQQARQQLREMPRLLHRMAQLMGVLLPPDYTLGQEQPELVDAVFERMWRFNQTYSIAGPLATTEDSVPVWYVMDEFGSSIQHESSQPSFRCVPFCQLPQRETYSVLFPIRDIACGDEVTRDYAEGPPCDPLTRAALLLPWEPCDMTHVDCCPPAPRLDFLSSGRKEETEPDPGATVRDVPRDRKLRVYSDYGQVRQCLTHPSFELVDEEKDADVLWLNYHFKQYRELSCESPSKRVNQFPFEHVLTVKDLLALVCRRGCCSQEPLVDADSLSSQPPWLPTTYNLQTELPHFVSYYQQRQKRGLDNVWICKPWNLARSLDTHVTDNLNYILRLPATGPKVACKYVSDPVLFPLEGVGLAKFDFRYVVVLLGVRPLRLYAYRHFWLRFANNSIHRKVLGSVSHAHRSVDHNRPFTLSDFDDYQKHFTVMNYTASGPQQTTCAQFLECFDEHYSSQPWHKVEAEVFQVLRQVFELACAEPPPAGVAHSPQSRAMYAVDLMLEWDRSQVQAEHPHMQPKLLEVNWAPDCQRACQFYPDFFNDVFAAMFLDEADSNPNFVPL